MTKSPRITNAESYESIKLRIDAQTLCQQLDRYVRGNRKAFSVVRVPTAEEERQRQQAFPRSRAIDLRGFAP